MEVHYIGYQEGITLQLCLNGFQGSLPVCHKVDMSVVLHVLVRELICLQQFKGTLVHSQYLAHIQVLLTEHLSCILQHLQWQEDSCQL